MNAVFRRHIRLRPLIGISIVCLAAIILLQGINSIAQAAGNYQQATPVPTSTSGNGETHNLYLPLVTNFNELIEENWDQTVAQPDVPSQNDIEPEPQTTPPASDSPPPVFQGEGAALTADVTALAQETGYSIESVAQSIWFQEAFGQYATQLMAHYPDQISAIWTEPVPAQKGHVQFTGEVPPDVSKQVTKQMLFPQNNPAQQDVVLKAENISLSGGGILSMAEHQRRAELVARSLGNQGYQNAITFFDPVRNVTQIELQLPEKALVPSKEMLTETAQKYVQTQLVFEQGIDVTASAIAVAPLDIELVIIRGTGPMIELQHSRGGNWLRDDGIRECTSGWSARSWNGVTGILTAGHCAGINQFEETLFSVYGAPWVRQVHDWRGDVEFHETNHWEIAEFYASSTEIRSVRAIMPTNSMVGGSVCVYGRSSNRRTCDHTVIATGVTMLMDGTTWVGNMVRATNVTTQGGDSGGGWSWGNTAWGIHNGRDGNGYSYFTPVEVAQSALGVTILTR